MLVPVGSAAAASVPAWKTSLPGGLAQGYSGGGFGSTGTGSGSAGGSTAAPGRQFSSTFSGSGEAINYTGYVPTSYHEGNAVPLVVSLHGCTESAAEFRQLTRWDQLAEARGFIVVFPEQTQRNNYLRCWNWFQSAHMQRASGEPALIAGITQWVQQRYSIDTRRTYVDGFSAGGAMSSVMAATYPDLYAAAAIGSGCEYAASVTCVGRRSSDPGSAGQKAASAMGSHARPMPVIVFHGDQDTTVPATNADQLVSQWETTDDLVDDGAKNGSIAAQPTKVTRGQVPNGRFYTVRSYSDRHGKELIQYWLVNGMGHAWSGGCGCARYSDPSGPDATGAMYAFFTNHPMPKGTMRPLLPVWPPIDDRLISGITGL